MCSLPYNPLVTVIIPTYNRSEFLRQAIASVIAQIYRPIQLIVVDDGSTEPIDTLVRELDTSSDFDLIYLRQNNAGVGAARNRGLDASQGELVAFLDSDDLWQPRMLESAIQGFITCPDAGIIVNGWNIIDENGVQQEDFNDPIRLWGERPQNLFRRLALGNLFPIHSAVTRKEKIDQIQGFRTSLLAFEDWDLWIRLSMKGVLTRFNQDHGASWRVYQGERRSRLSLTDFETALRQVFSPLLLDPIACEQIKDYGEHIYAWQIIARIRNTKVFPQEDPSDWVKRSEELYLIAPKNPEISRKYLDVLVNLDYAKPYFQRVQAGLPPPLLQKWWVGRYIKCFKLALKDKAWIMLFRYGFRIFILKVKIYFRST